MLLAFLVNSFIYFSFVNSYSSTLLNIETFSEQFHSGVYQYRILGGKFLLWTYELLGYFDIDYTQFKLKFLDEDSDPRMYLSFYVLNTVFLILTSIILALLFRTPYFIAIPSEKILIGSVAILLIGISQFVVLPYDCVGYFFHLLFIWVFLRYLEKEKFGLLVVLVILVFFSTLNRESSALSLAFAGTILYRKYGISKKTSTILVLFLLPFIFAYFGLRIIHDEFTTNDGALVTENFSMPKNILGILFWLALFVLTTFISNSKYNIRYIIIFHLLSLPYIFMCFWTGILYEIRLYIPIFLSSLLLAKIEVSKKM